jgi:hypothetical protein
MKARLLFLTLLLACGGSQPTPATTPTSKTAPPERTCCCIFSDGASEIAVDACAAQRGTCDTEMTECHFLGPTP